MTDLNYQSASDITARIGNGELNPREVAHRTLDRISDIDPRLNAVVVVAKDEMLTAAEQLDRDGARGLLAGVPVTIKEAIGVSGLPTT